MSRREVQELRDRVWAACGEHTSLTVEELVQHVDGVVKVVTKAKAGKRA